MDGTPFFVMGFLFGIATTLFVQFLGNRKARKALKDAALAGQGKDAVVEQQRVEAIEMKRRIAALETIITDQPRQLASDIESLR